MDDVDINTSFNFNDSVKVFYPDQNENDDKLLNSYLSNTIKLENYLLKILEKYSEKLWNKKRNLNDLFYVGSNTFKGLMSFTFVQKFKNVKVSKGEIVLNFDSKGNLLSIYNEYRNGIPDRIDVDDIISESKCLNLAEEYSEIYGLNNIHNMTAELIIYEHGTSNDGPVYHYSNKLTIQFMNRIEKNRLNQVKKGYYIAWKVKFHVNKPLCHWCIIIDAKNGKILNLIDLIKYFTGKGNVFDPNPTIKSGNLMLSHLTNLNEINSYLRSVDITNLREPIEGYTYLNGKYVKIRDKAGARNLPPTSRNGQFHYKYREYNFLCVNAYYHINKFMEYVVNELKFSEFINFNIDVDVDGVEDEDNSFYVSNFTTSGAYIAFSSMGNPDASDEFVILHELFHALVDKMKPGFVDNDGINEGAADALSMIYFDDKHVNPNKTRCIVMSWDSSPIEINSNHYRRCDIGWKFDDPQYTAELDNHKRGQLVSSILFEIYRKIGGDSNDLIVKHMARDLTIELIFLSMFPLSRTNALSKHFFDSLIIIAHNNFNEHNDLIRQIRTVFKDRRIPGYFP